MNHRTAIVTGAASGLGQGYAVRLAEAGFRLALVDRAPSDDTLRMIDELGSSDQARAFRCDISRSDEVATTAAAIEDAFGRADVLVNNAGIYPNCPFDELNERVWRKVLSVNLDGTYFMCAAVLPQMRRQRWGRIINIASAAVWLELKDATPYIASKMGVIGLTRALASEVGSDGVTVNCIAPGMVLTPGTADAIHARAFDHLRVRQSIDISATPDDVAGVVAFLASDEARFITGQTIVVDGGMIRA